MEDRLDLQNPVVPDDDENPALHDPVPHWDDVEGDVPLDVADGNEEDDRVALDVIGDVPLDVAGDFPLDVAGDAPLDVAADGNEEDDRVSLDVIGDVHINFAGDVPLDVAADSGNEEDDRVALDVDPHLDQNQGEIDDDISDQEENGNKIIIL